MQALLMHPHIVANIFVFYSLTRMDFVVMVRHILGHIDGDEEINSRIMAAINLYVKVLLTSGTRDAKNGRNIEMLAYIINRGATIKNHNRPMFDKATDHLVVGKYDNERIIEMRYGVRWFRAKLAPSRFRSGELASLTVYNWDASTYVTGIRELLINGNMEAPIPNGVKSLGMHLEYMKNDIIPPTVNRLLIFNNEDMVAWWEGVDNISIEHSSGAVPKREKIVKLNPDNVYSKLRSMPSMQKHLKVLHIRVIDATIAVLSTTPGDIVPTISTDAIDFRDLKNENIYIIYVNQILARKIYLPAKNHLTYLFVPGAGRVIYDGALPYLKSTCNRSLDQVPPLKDFAPNLLSLTTGEAELVESDSIVELTLLNDSCRPKLQCPKLRKVTVSSGNFVSEGWVQARKNSRMYLRRAPLELDPVDFTIVDEDTFVIHNEEEYIMQRDKFRRAGLIVDELNN